MCGQVSICGRGSSCAKTADRNRGPEHLPDVPCLPNDDNRSPSRGVHVYCDFRYGDEAEQEVDEILAPMGMDGEVSSGDSTLEPLKPCDIYE